MVIYSLLDEYWIAASVYQRSDLTHEEQITPVHNSEMSYGPEEICMEEISSANVEMQRKIDKLQVKLVQVQSSFQRSLFRLENICDNDDLVTFYTGFSDYKTLLAFYEEILESDAKVMRQWEGKNS